MGTGLVDSDDVAAHEAYKNFRKFQELCQRLSTHSKEMKAELEFGTMDDAVIDKRKGKRKGSNNKIGPSHASRPPLAGAVMVLEECADTLV